MGFTEETRRDRGSPGQREYRRRVPDITVLVIWINIGSHGVLSGAVRACNINISPIRMEFPRMQIITLAHFNSPSSWMDCVDHGRWAYYRKEHDAGWLPDDYQGRDRDRNHSEVTNHSALSQRFQIVSPYLYAWAEIVVGRNFCTACISPQRQWVAHTGKLPGEGGVIVILVAHPRRSRRISYLRSGFQPSYRPSLTDAHTSIQTLCGAYCLARQSAPVHFLSSPTYLRPSSFPPGNPSLSRTPTPPCTPSRARA